MAIGSDPEIGVEFARWGDMTDTARAAWFEYVRLTWGGDLLNGYARLVYPDISRWCVGCGAGPDDDCFTDCQASP